MRNLVSVMTAMMMAGLAACAKPDPASEVPVDLLPGLYQVRVGGGTIVDLKSGGMSGEICFAIDNALAFPSNALSHLVPDWEGCSTSYDDPKGNAVSGLRTCPGGDGYRRKKTTRANFAGSHSTDSFLIEGEVRQGDDEGGGVMHLGSGPFQIKGKRIGDCS